MEILESLWFFNNVLNSPTSQQKDHVHELGSVHEEEEESAKHKNILVPSCPCPKCGEIEQQIVEPVKAVEMEFAIEKKRRNRRRRSKRKGFGELDLGFHGNLASESWFSEEIFGYPNQIQNYTKMPPLNDGLAMKEHLKSWAYAVACTLR